MAVLRRGVALRDIGIVLLAVWLILTGISSVAAFALPGVLMGTLALAAGILLLLPR